MVHDLNIVDWQEDLLRRVSCFVEADDYWRERFAYQQNSISSPFAIHLAVFVEPYLSFLLNGTKTIESRFSRKFCPPYNCLHPGDAVLLKRSGGPVIGICQAGSVWNYQLDLEAWSDIQRYATALCVSSPEFWEQRAGSSFAMLMRVEHVLKIESLPCRKRDRRGWVVLKPRSEHLELRETNL